MTLLDWTMNGLFLETNNMIEPKLCMMVMDNPLHFHVDRKHKMSVMAGQLYI